MEIKMKLTNPIATGNTADIFLQEGKIIKLFKEYLQDGEAEYEANKQKMVRSYGLPVPCVYEVTKIAGRQAIIMEYAAGKTIADRILEDETTAEQYLNLTVDIQLKIHAIKPSSMELISDKLSRNINTASELSETQKAALLENLRSIPYENRLCHGDYHPFNLILNETGIKIIDWVDAGMGDVRADVCSSYLLLSQFSVELANLYLRIYCEKSGLSQDDIFVWMPIVAGAGLSGNVSSKQVELYLDIVGQYCNK
jgi:aminoglycoside phosphotransferase (APT) family kinase protein